jgi:hypothetical protein
MCHLTLALSMLVVFGSQEPTRPPSADGGAFEAAKAQAGRDPAKLVKLALWCESRGMGAERRAALEQAVRLDPDNQSARGLLGQVAYRGRWESPEAVSERMKEDEALTAKLAEYNARRDRIERDTEIERRSVARLEERGNHARAAELKHGLDRRLAPEHVRLGLWCEKVGLKPEANAHFTTALHLNPHDHATWRHLGYVQHHGRWMSHGQIAAEEHEALAQKHADHHWGPLLHRWVTELRDRRRRAGAEANLAKVSDPRAIPSIVRAFGESTAAGQRMVVHLLGRIDAPPSSSRLAVLAVTGDTPEVREAAARALKGREPRDYAEWLVNLIRAPMTYQMRPVGGPGTQGALLIDSPRFRILRTYDAPPAFRLSSTYRGYVGYDINGLPVVMDRWDVRHYEQAFSGGDPRKIHLAAAENILHRAELRMAELVTAAQMKALVARERLAADVGELEELNAEAAVVNRRAEDALRVAMDAPQRLGDDDENAWSSWFYERIGYRYMPPHKVVAVVNAVPQLPAPLLSGSCFVAGTPVRTIGGPRPIESIRTGDQVLGRDVATGALAFRPVVAVHHNPPDQTLRIALDNGDAIVVSRFHRFWLAGRGWAMARDLKAGDVLRTLGATPRITAIEPAPVQPVFNLDVAELRTYFVGRSAILVHDNTMPPPHPSEPPFDLVTDPADPSR